MKPMLPIIATLALISTAWGQAPVVPLENYPADPTPSANGQGPAPVVGLAEESTLKFADDSTPPGALVANPGSPAPIVTMDLATPMSGDDCAGMGCGDQACGCVGPCQGACGGEGLRDTFSQLRCCPPNCRCLLCLPKEMWFSASYMHTFAKTRPLTAVVTTSPDGTPRDLAGVLPGATVLFGGEGIGGGANAGMRLEAGRWLGDGHVGFGGRFFYTESDSDGFEASANGTSPILALPYFDPISNMEDALLLSHPDVATDGRVSIDYDLEVLSSEPMLRFKIARGRGVHLDLTGGYHFAKVDDSLLLRAETVDIDNTNLVINGTHFDITDSFSAKNTFHGGSIGLNLKLVHGRVTVRGMSKLSVGNVHQELFIAGNQVITLPPIAGGGIATVNNGVYAQQSIIGAYDRDRTSFVPEASLQVGYRMSRCLEFNVGYSMLYFTNVALAGSAVDHAVDLNGAGGPNVTFSDTSLWLQGVTIGGAYKF